MKKPAFIVTETILSLVLAASVAAVAVLTIDIKTDGGLIPKEIFNPSQTEESKPSQNSEPSVSVQESKDESSQQQSSKQESKLQESSQSEQSEEISEPEESQQSEESSEPEESQQSEEVSEPEESQQSEESSEPEESQQSEEVSELEESQQPEENSQPEESQEPQESSNGSTQNLILQEPANLSTQPEQLTTFINNFGYGYGNLDSDLDRLIIVDTGSESKADIYCYQRADSGYWWNIAGENNVLTDKGFVGEGGLAFDVTPDSNKTPMGFYYTGEAFYIGDKPDSSYPMFQVTNNTYWVTDPSSAFFNKHVEGTSEKDWSSAIQMISDSKAYKYGLVVRYNTDSPKGNLASGIFMYCGSEATKGGIAVPEETMKTILEWLGGSQKVYVYIT